MFRMPMTIAPAPEGTTVLHDITVPFEERARKIVSLMTLEEKAGQMMSNAPAIPRLGIPAYHWWNECLHGVGRAGIATVFPQAIGLAATFEPGLLFKVARAIADEARAKHHQHVRETGGDSAQYLGLTFWSPNINIFRDPRWGRGQETYGEDPYLTGRLGVAFVKGLQGDDPIYLKLVATPKHYAVHSGPEKDRHSFDAVVSKKDLFETYLPAFRDCVREAGAWSVMGAYNRTNGEPCCASPTLLEGILRGMLGFKGFVVSDCGAIDDFHRHHKVTPDARASAALAVARGCDLNCGRTYAHLPAAVRDGLVTEAAIDACVTRLMLARLKLGMFDPVERVPHAAIPFDVNDCPAHRALALEAAEKSIVLLRNDGILPLEPGSLAGATIAVIGPNAHDRNVLLGNYNGTPSASVTLLEGIKAAFTGAAVVHARGCGVIAPAFRGVARARAVARQASVVVACMGTSQLMEGEQGALGFKGDREGLSLPRVQQQLLDAILDLGKPVVLVLLNGSPVTLGKYIDHPGIKAIVEAWFPGEEGGTAIARVLSGMVNPSGRLPVTFPASIDDVPDIAEYRMAGRTYRFATREPSFPFGHGLSYTSFTYSDPSLPAASITAGDAVELSATVTNAGTRPGDEIVQLYVKDEAGSARVPVHSLRGVRRVSLGPGESTRVAFTIVPADLALVMEDGTSVVEPGAFTLLVGGRQPTARAAALAGGNVVEARLVVTGPPFQVPF